MPSQDSRVPTTTTSDHARTATSISVDTAPPSQSVPTSGLEKAPAKSGTRATAVAGVSDLVRRVYDGTFKRKRPSKADILAIRADPLIAAEARGELLDAASKDVALAQTYQLLATLVGFDDSGFANARDFARQVLRDHPAFQHPDLVAILDSRADSLRPEKAVECLASRDFRLLPDPEQERSKAAVVKQSKECKENAIRCLLLWLFARREISLDRTRELLHHHIWSTYAHRHKASADRLQALLAAKQASALTASITSELLEKQVTQQTYRADEMQQAEARATARAEKVQQELEELQRQHAESLERGRLLDQELTNQKTAHADERAHLQDDYERLRGTVLRRLKDELTLMEEGLHALQRDPPRVHVMVDHADRVIDGLRLAIEWLREGRQV